MIKTLELLKQRFLTGMKPTQQDFHDLIDTLADGSRLKVTEHSETTYSGSPTDGELVFCSSLMGRVTITDTERQGVAMIVFRPSSTDALRLPSSCMVSGDISSLTSSGPLLATGRTYIMHLMPRMAEIRAVYSAGRLPQVGVGDRRLLTEDGRLLTLEGRN